MKNRIVLLAFLLFFLFKPVVEIQAQQKEQLKHSVTLSPQYWLAKGIRLDYDRQIAGKKQFINYALLFYMDDANNNADLLNWYHEYEHMLGAGIRVYHKLFFASGNPPGQGIYFSYGGSLEGFGFDIPRARWIEYTEDGFDYYEYEYYMGRQYNVKAGLDLIFGWQGYEDKNFLFDLYFGIAARYAEAFTQMKYPYSFRTAFLDYGYRGVHLLAGFKIGGFLP